MRILQAVKGEDNHHEMKSGVPHVINEVNATTDDEAISKGSTLTTFSSSSSLTAPMRRSGKRGVNSSTIRHDCVDSLHADRS